MSQILDDLADSMFAPAVRLVSAVHDRDQAATYHLLEGLSGMELRALAVNLAALVPDDQALSTLLAWTRGVAPISDRQAERHRLELEAEVAAYARSRRGAA